MYMFNFRRVSTKYSRVLISRLVSVQCCNYKMSSGSICLAETQCLKSTLLWPFKDQCFHHIETSHLICRANQLTRFYTIGTLVVKGLKQKKIRSSHLRCSIKLSSDNLIKVTAEKCLWKSPFLSKFLLNFAATYVRLFGKILMTISDVYVINGVWSTHREVFHSIAVP